MEQAPDFQAEIVNLEWAMAKLIRIVRCSKAATAIEYALVASLIAIAAIGAMTHLGNSIDSMFNNVSNAL
jgi:pilus assembly protein Flp/PilA